MTDVPSAHTARRERWYDGLLRGIYVVRVPLAMGVLSALVLSLVDQVREVHRVLTQERAANTWHLHWLLALASLVALSVVLWQMARQHAEDSEDGDDPEAAETAAPAPLYGWVLRWGPRLLAMLPLLGAGLGIWLSRLPNIDLTNAPPSLVEPLKIIAALQTHFLIGALICLALAVLVFIGACIFERKLAPVGSGRSRRVALINNWLLFPLVILVSIVLFVRDPVHLPQSLGSIPIFALWMVNLAVLTALFARYHRRFGVPVLAFAFLLLVVFEVFGLTDNHEFRHQASTVQRPSIESAFRSWLAARKDAPAYLNANRPYPVYIVAAEGGGLYAAYQTAMFLARMQDLCPTFAQHLFSISSVSGGSLGAGVFAALAKSFASNTEGKPCLDKLDTVGPFEGRADSILSRDLLAPVVWGGLFPDFLQRFLPQPIPAFDRARALEFAFEEAWYHGAGRSENPMKESLFALCGNDDPACTKTATPTLDFNVTNIETGMQMVLSPLDFTSIGPPWSGSAKVFDFFATGIDPVDIPLSTAIGLSARFPWISPAGWYTFTDPTDKVQAGTDRKRRMSFVDGGYVDNSGVATASKLAQSLAEFVAKTPAPVNVDINLIMISAAWIPFDRFWMDEPVNKSQSELLSPLVAALAAWQGRGYTMQYDQAADPRPGFKILEAGVYYNFLPLPLGWQLSSVSRGYIDLFKGHPEKCDQTQLDRSLESHALLANSYINRANCVAAEIARDLTPTAAPVMMRSITPAK
jgi:cytochrome bd-type quinol oxidase subunit 2